MVHAGLINADGRWPTRWQTPAGARKIVADNRKARFNYEIVETYEAGIALTGTEVKSLRGGKATIGEAYAGPTGERALPLQRLYPGIPAGQPLQPRDRAGRASCCCTSAQIAKLIGADAARGHDARSAQALFQRRAAARRSSWRSAAARSCTTSARPRRSATGSASGAPDAREGLSCHIRLALSIFVWGDPLTNVAIESMYVSVPAVLCARLSSPFRPSSEGCRPRLPRRKIELRCSAYGAASYPRHVSILTRQVQTTLPTFSKLSLARVAGIEAAETGGHGNEPSSQLHRRRIEGHPWRGLTPSTAGSSR